MSLRLILLAAFERQEHGRTVIVPGPTKGVDGFYGQKHTSRLHQSML
ncbi:hypothetical protein BH20ACI2_BH20ACI2_17360 [soil metagenome]